MNNKSMGMLGNRNATRKLTDEDASMIRQIHEEGREQIKKINSACSIRALAEKFEVHPRTIEKVLSYEHFKGVK